MPIRSLLLAALLVLAGSGPSAAGVTFFSVDYTYWMSLKPEAQLTVVGAEFDAFQTAFNVGASKARGAWIKALAKTQGVSSSQIDVAAAATQELTKPAYYGDFVSYRQQITDYYKANPKIRTPVSLIMRCLVLKETLPPSACLFLLSKIDSR